jgi:hypothetical protein
MAVIPAGKWSIESVRGANGEPVKIVAWSSFTPQSLLTEAGYEATLKSLADVATGKNAGALPLVSVTPDAITAVVAADAEYATVVALQKVLTHVDLVT